MADVRALLAAERQSRRISHPLLTYSKTGALSCNVCNLNVKSEQLWPGHLKSLNHRKNVQKISVEPARPTKRKLDSVEANGDDEERNYEVDSRKKPKPIPELELEPEPEPEPDSEIVETVPDKVATPESVQAGPGAPLDSEEDNNPQLQVPVAVAPEASKDVDEDEWAAFEREVAPLAQANYTSATIEAAPVSAAEIVAQQRTNTVQQREDEAEAEKEEESRRMEEEFEVMEEMEDRVKRLRARREALRPQDPASNIVPVTETESSAQDTIVEEANGVHGEPSSDDEEVDDWYE